LLTTLYPQDTRPDLKKDTRAIHYFVRQWIKSGHEVVVLHMFFHPVKKVYKYKFKVFGRDIQETEVDGVKLLLMENQLMWPRAGKLTGWNQRKAVKNITGYFIKELPNFRPDVMFVHFPSYLTGVADELFPKSPKVAVLNQ